MVCFAKPETKFNLPSLKNIFPVSDLIIICEQTQCCLVEKCYSLVINTFIEENSSVKRLYFSINFNSY